MMWNGRFAVLFAPPDHDNRGGPLARLIAGAAIVLIRAYQLILSPLLPGECRFHPTCSRYAAEAFRRHPPHRALWLTLRRIARCHPFHPGGNDPVP